MDNNINDPNTIAYDSITEPRYQISHLHFPLLLVLILRPILIIITYSYFLFFLSFFLLSSFCCFLIAFIRRVFDSERVDTGNTQVSLQSTGYYDDSGFHELSARYKVFIFILFLIFISPYLNGLVYIHQYTTSHWLPSTYCTPLLLVFGWLDRASLSPGPHSALVGSTSQVLLSSWRSMDWISSRWRKC